MFVKKMCVCLKNVRFSHHPPTDTMTGPLLRKQCWAQGGRLKVERKGSNGRWEGGGEKAQIAILSRITHNVQLFEK